MSSNEELDFHRLTLQRESVQIHDYKNLSFHLLKIEILNRSHTTAKSETVGIHFNLSVIIAIKNLKSADATGVVSHQIVLQSCQNPHHLTVRYTWGQSVTTSCIT